MNNALGGNVAVGLVIVDGPAGSTAEFTAAEKLDIAIGIGQGWNTLYGLAGTYAPVRPRLIFVAETKVVKLTLDPATVPAPTNPAPGSADYNAREPLWRDPALTALGYGTGTSGIASYNRALLNASWSIGTATSAYTVFVTKYSNAWMAYTQPSDAYMVLQYDWVSTRTPMFPAQPAGHQGIGWGNSWPNVYAHETGHIFQAPDEYFASHCTRTSVHGALHIPNANCQLTDGQAVTPCLMLANTSNLCSPTVRTFGWVDDNHDGVLDVTP